MNYDVFGTSVPWNQSRSDQSGLWIQNINKAVRVWICELDKLSFNGKIIRRRPSVTARISDQDSNDAFISAVVDPEEIPLNDAT